MIDNGHTSLGARYSSRGGNGKLVREVPVSWTNRGDPTIPGWTLVGFKKNYYGPDWLIYRPKGVSGNQWNHTLMVD